MGHTSPSACTSICLYRIYKDHMADKRNETAALQFSKHIARLSPNRTKAARFPAPGLAMIIGKEEYSAYWSSLAFASGIPDFLFDLNDVAICDHILGLRRPHDWCNLVLRGACRQQQAHSHEARSPLCNECRGCRQAVQDTATRSALSLYEALSAELFPNSLERVLFHGC